MTYSSIIIPGSGGAGADTEAPSTPTGLNATNKCQTTFTLNWTASTDNVGVTGYKIFKNGGLYTDTGSTATSHGITGQTAGASNTWTIKAYDAAANESAASSGLVVVQAITVTETSNSVTIVSKTTATAACTEAIVGDTAPHYITGGNGTIDNNETIYTDSCAQNVLVGGNQYYSDGTYSFQVANNGLISNRALCP